MSALDRITGRLTAPVARRVTEITGAEELDAVAARVASLEAAVAENAALEAPLERLVTELERAVAGVVEQSVTRRVGP